MVHTRFLIALVLILLVYATPLAYAEARVHLYFHSARVCAGDKVELRYVLKSSVAVPDFLRFAEPPRLQVVPLNPDSSFEPRRPVTLITDFPGGGPLKRDFSGYIRLDQRVFAKEEKSGLAVLPPGRYRVFYSDWQAHSDTAYFTVDPVPDSLRAQFDWYGWVVRWSDSKPNTGSERSALDSLMLALEVFVAMPEGAPYREAALSRSLPCVPSLHRFWSRVDSVKFVNALNAYLLEPGSNPRIAVIAAARGLFPGVQGNELVKRLREFARVTHNDLLIRRVEDMRTALRKYNFD